ncbi:hypothetical protein [Actinophytocola gossypii]|uniref:Uncharacterized protein n=1 Tax=Actinophytocola gossypii TaxID=2812003 RepID=A0ABT2JHY5_9PSEU|nr:hypothetical protein [Actinophytocola gossypii]MCT2587497.1 hypothetical protein [Actinophytocola gossypii]
MTARDRVLLVVLMLDAVVLGVVELMFLPLSFDGYLLPNLGGFPLPLMPLLAAVTTPLLVSVAGTLSPRVVVAAAPLAAWIVTVAWVGVFGPGGDVLLTADWRSLLLFGCGALPSAVVLGRVLAATHSAPR